MAEGHKFENLQETIRSLDRVGAVSPALRSAEDGSISISSFYDELSRILVQTGVGWQRGTVEFWQEHLVIAVERYVTDLRRAHPELRISVCAPAFALDNESWPPEMVLDPRAVPTPEEK